ncbi:MAG: hypothetical protein HQM10_03400 [Candidatus Riflebacteria bacterium]|nr:hypothetical protein [Candidatus Riflebacteria bacterium]
MSRSYAIRLPLNILLAPVAREKLGSFSMTFELMEILPIIQMQHILRQILIKRGFIETDQGLAMPCKYGNSAVFFPETMTMRLNVPVPKSMEVTINDDFLPDWLARIQSAKENNELISPELTKMAQDELGQKASEELFKLAIEARGQINAALKEAYRDAIREKASKLGTVSDVTESNDGSTYRIRIEVKE